MQSIIFGDSALEGIRQVSTIPKDEIKGYISSMDPVSCIEDTATELKTYTPNTNLVRDINIHIQGLVNVYRLLASRVGPLLE